MNLNNLIGAFIREVNCLFGISQTEKAGLLVWEEGNVTVASSLFSSVLSEEIYWFQASGIVRKDYDQKRKLLRQLESNGESSDKIDKTRAVVKDLHSRIRVAIHRIDSISKKIEDLRDKELQPQLEELIEGYVLLSSFVIERNTRCE